MLHGRVYKVCRGLDKGGSAGFYGLCRGLEVAKVFGTAHYRLLKAPLQFLTAP